RIPDEREESTQFDTVRFSHSLAAMPSSPVEILQSEIRAFFAVIFIPSLFGILGLFKILIPCMLIFSQCEIFRVQLWESFIVMSCTITLSHSASIINAPGRSFQSIQGSKGPSDGPAWLSINLSPCRVLFLSYSSGLSIC